MRRIIDRIAPSMRKLPLLVVFCLSMAACFPHYISDYDSATYRNLTNLKAEAMVFYDELAKDPTGGGLSVQDIKTLQLDASKTYEYEKGKTKNDETITQIEEIKKMLVGSIDLLHKSGKLSPDYIQDKREQIDKAFEIAIKTEKSKLSK